jgi:hypothetical protein
VSSENGGFLLVETTILGIKSETLRYSERLSCNVIISTFNSLNILTHSFSSSVRIDIIICSGLT